MAGYTLFVCKVVTLLAVDVFCPEAVYVAAAAIIASAPLATGLTSRPGTTHDTLTHRAA